MSQRDGGMLSESAIKRLASDVDGELLQPGETGFDEARRVFNGMIDRTPIAIFRCASGADVKRGVDFARDLGLAVSVKGGGHSVAGHAVADGALMLDLSGMKTARVDPVARTTTVGPGLTLGDFDQATQEFGLACPTGLVSVTGLAGLTLGGGLGWLSGKHGLACDNLAAVELVTADGEVVTATDENNPDLFWAVRGGGGNFGVATAFTFRLHPIHRVLAGGVVYPPERARDALCFYHEFASAAPDELTANGSVWRGEDGRVRVSVGVCHVGPVEHGQELLAPLREFCAPEADEIQVMSYEDLQSANDDSYPPGQQHYWKACSMSEIHPESAELIVDFVSRMPSPASGVGFQQMHGAASNIGLHDTAYPDRQPHYDVLILSQWSDPAETEANITWTRSLFEALRPFSNRAVYVNNLGQEGEDRVLEAYGPNYERLSQIKQKYDPTNFFRLNHNVHPKR